MSCSEMCSCSRREAEPFERVLGFLSVQMSGCSEVCCFERSRPLEPLTVDCRNHVCEKGEEGERKSHPMHIDSEVRLTVFTMT